MRTLVLAGAVLAAACSEGGPGGDAVEVTDSAGMRVVTVQMSPDELPSWTVAAPGAVVLDGNAAPFFQRVTSGAWLSDGGLVVLDRGADQLHLFDAEGNYLGPFGRSGDGPGEFANIATVTVTREDSMVVFDRVHDRLTVLHPDAGFVRDQSMRNDSAEVAPTDAYVLSSDRFALSAVKEDLSWLEGYDGRAFVNRAETRVTMHDGSGARVAGPVVLPGPLVAQFSWGSGTIPFSARPAVAGAGGRVVTGAGDEWTIRVHSEDLVPVMEIRWHGRREPVTSADLEEVRENIRTTFAPLGEERMQEVLGLFLSEDAVPGDRPAYGRIVADHDGAIWVARHEPYREQTDWTVLGADGVPVGTVRFPEGARLLAAAGDAVMFVLPDSLDVQSVHVASVPELGEALDTDASPRTGTAGT